MLTELRVTLDRAELAYTGSDATAGLNGANEVLAAFDALPLTESEEGLVLQRDARRLRAAALESIGELRQAIVVLEQLAADPTPDAAWLKGLIALVRCRRELGDFDEAVRVLDDATPAIGELGIGDLTEAIQLTVTIAGVFNHCGEIARATQLGKRALADAERVGSAIGRASALWNIAVGESCNGAHESAVQLLREALAAFEEGEDSRNLPRLRLELAYALLLMGPARAEEALGLIDQYEREIEWLPSTAVDRVLSHVYRGFASILLGRFEEAAASIRLCNALTPSDANRLTAEIQGQEGMLAAREGRPDSAFRHYRIAIDSALALGTHRVAAQLWLELGENLDQLGEAEAAKDAYRRAAETAGVRAGPTARRPSD